MYTACTSTLYLVDPDSAVRDAIAMLLSAPGLQIQSFSSGRKLLAAKPSSPGCVLVEHNLPDTNALILLEQLKALDSNLPVLIMTSSTDRGLDRQARSKGAQAVIRKPLQSRELLALLEPLLTQ